jgi:hypothetical protein
VQLPLSKVSSCGARIIPWCSDSHYRSTRKVTFAARLRKTGNQMLRLDSFIFYRIFVLPLSNFHPCIPVISTVSSRSRPLSPVQRYQLLGWSIPTATQFSILNPASVILLSNPQADYRLVFWSNVFCFQMSGLLAIRGSQIQIPACEHFHSPLRVLELCLNHRKLFRSQLENMQWAIGEPPGKSPSAKRNRAENPHNHAMQADLHIHGRLAFIAVQCLPDIMRETAN